MNDESTIRTALIAACEKRGTQAEISKSFDVSQSTVKRWVEGGEIPPPMLKLLDWYLLGSVPPRIADPSIDTQSILNFEEREWANLSAMARREGVTEATFIAGRIRSYLAFYDGLQVETSPKTGPVSFDPPSNLIELPFFGTVAAGQPGGPVDVADGTHPVPGDYDPATHYVLRVHGQSMEPEYLNGSFIVCRKLKTGEFATKGQDVIACDAAGAYFKRLLYTKDGKKGDSPRKAKPHLTSINPDYPEVVPVADCPIVAVVVSKA